MNEPAYVHQFLESAARFGLEFLAESSTPGFLSGLPAPAQEAISRWADDAISREQYLDFVCNRSFRQTVLRRAGGPPASGLTPDAIAGLFVSTAVVPAGDEVVVADDSSAEFTRPENAGSLTTSSPLVKAALLTLLEEQPRAVDFETLWARVRSRLAEAGRPLPRGTRRTGSESSGAPSSGSSSPISSTSTSGRPSRRPACPGGRSRARSHASRRRPSLA